jgi:hypothetical protein
VLQVKGSELADRAESSTEKHQFSSAIFQVKRSRGGKGATITIKFTDARKGAIILDVTDAEGEKLGEKGRRQARRGRRPRVAS